MKKIVIVLILVLVMFTQVYGYESVFFNDGGYHKIDYILNAQVYVDRDNPGVGTKLELVEGGGIAPGQGYGTIHCFNDSQVTVSGGNMGWSLMAWDRSTVKLTGGYVGREFFSRSSNMAYMSGGSVATVVTFGNGSFDISGGTVRSELETQGNTLAMITGGNIYRINCLDSSQMYISGGTITGKISAGFNYSNTNSLISLFGNNFTINSQPIAPGEYVSSYARNGRIAGILADGSILNTSFVLNRNADILIASEPAKLQSIEISGPNSVPEESDTQYNVIGLYDNNSTSDITADANLAVTPDEFAVIDANGLLSTARLYQMRETCTIYADYQGLMAYKPVIIYPVCDGNQCSEPQLLKRNIADTIEIKQDVMENIDYAMKIEQASVQILSGIPQKPGQLTKARVQILAALMWEQWANKRIDESIDRLEIVQKILEENLVEKHETRRK